MEDTHSSDASDGSSMSYRLAPLPSQECPVCASRSGLLRCSGCRVVGYCGTAHQSVHRSEHKTACKAIKKSRENLEREEAALRAQPADFMMPADVFTNGVGRFWGIVGTRDYMRARFAAASALLEVESVRAVEMALDHLKDMLDLCRSDNLGVRDIVPNLLLRLGKEQECYDFLKWWAVIDDKDHYNGKYNWSDPTQPYLDIHNANVFEPIGILCSGNLSLTQLAALTLLKLRLYLDLDAYATKAEDMFESDMCYYEPDRPVGRLVRARMRTNTMPDLSATAEILKEQYLELCEVVHKKNPHFWEALVEEEASYPPPILFAGFSRGSGSGCLPMFTCLARERGCHFDG